MKANILILFFVFPTFCFSQNRNNTTTEKPSTTDCPDFNDKNKPKNKADYYRNLRSRKPVRNQEMSNGLYPISKPRNYPPQKEEPDLTYTQKTAKADIEIEDKKEKETKTEHKDNLGIGSNIIESKAKNEKEEKTKKKTKRLPKRKTTKARKRNASACPNF